MYILRIAAAFTLCGCFLFAQQGFDPKALDLKADPCTDFYQYACGSWMANNPIPADQASWGRFTQLHERNQRILRDILETSSGKTTRTAVEQKIGDYFSTCMDEKAIDAKSTEPLKPYFSRIQAISNKSQLTEEIMRLHKSGVYPFFSVGSTQDMKDATEVIAYVDQGGIGLPERDYYFKDDAKSAELRKQYIAHVQKMFELIGEKPEAAAAKAKIVMNIETALAKGSLDVTSRRDPEKIYHRLPVKELIAMNPSIEWERYLAAIGAPVKNLNVAVPDFFKQLEAQLKAVSLDDWKVYLTWHVVHSAAPVLPTAFVNENFEFYGKALTGSKELRPRWKRCVQYTDADLGEALGQKYVELTFGQEGKDKTLAMVRALEKALERDIQQLDWMTPATKKRALEKLHAITNKIGFPEQWRDYSKLEIKKGDAIGNSFRSNMFEFNRQIEKIGKPVDKKEWFMTPPTVNAYYDPQNNNINFPAGILQPPFYDVKLDEAVNFGAIGAVIGHELTHGFDDEGGRFDAKGNLADWWTEADSKAFQQRTACVEKQYSEYKATDDLKLNGKLTLGENVADNGGLRIAYMALMDTLAGKKVDKIDGYTPEQRLFLGWGQIWCQNQTEKIRRMYAQTDPHSPGQWRVNGAVSNMPEFQKAFGCKVGQPMVRGENACRVW
jgi:endothelin-converting enzyme/putative endopeptidase